MKKNRVYWEHRLDSIPTNSIADKNIVFLLNLFPEGLTVLELQILCRRNPKWFGEFEKLEILKRDSYGQEKELPYRDLINTCHMDEDVT